MFTITSDVKGVLILSSDMLLLLYEAVDFL